MPVHAHDLCGSVPDQMADRKAATGNFWPGTLKIFALWPFIEKV